MDFYDFIPLVAGICFVALIVGGGIIVERYCVSRLTSPTCTGRAWRSLFPNAPKQQIRDYLQIVIDAFLLQQRYRLRFDPSVKVLDLYRAQNAGWFGLGVDSMELETFADEVEDRFGLDLYGCWNDDLTLGQIFALATGPQRSPAGRG